MNRFLSNLGCGCFSSCSTDARYPKCWNAKKSFCDVIASVLYVHCGIVFHWRHMLHYIAQHTNNESEEIHCGMTYTAIVLTNGLCIHSKTPHVVTVLWLDSDDVVTILSPTRNLVEGYKTVYLCHLDSYTVTVCSGYLVSSNVVTVQLPTRCLVDRFLHRPHGSGYLITCVSHVVTVL